MLRFNLRSGIRSALLAAALFAAAPAHAQTDAPGLPMWVIKDKDSTIYITGTVHMLPPDVQWTSDKLKKAIHDSKELWLEIAMGSDVNKFAVESMPVMLRYAMSTKSLSTLLTEEERGQLKAAIAKAGLPPETVMMLNMMKPWYASVLVGLSPLMAAGFDPTKGIDINIAKLAEDDGDPIKGFETIEFQTKLLASGTEEEQLAALRAVLKAEPKASKEDEEKSISAFTAWAHGDIGPAHDLFARMDDSELGSTGGAAMDALLKNRNENWAGQIEQMLKGSGVSFIAVGAGHLVGPDSVFDRLKLRGIEATRY